MDIDCIIELEDGPVRACVSYEIERTTFAMDDLLQSEVEIYDITAYDKKHQKSVNTMFDYPGNYRNEFDAITEE